METTIKIEKKIRITGRINILTGLHIGGNSDNVEIGGIDRLVIKLASIDNKAPQPYIPGSSLRGKMRCLLEQVEGISGEGKCTSNKVTDLFGSNTDSKDNKVTLSRLIVRDAKLDNHDELFKCTTLDLPYTEVKSENTIDRITGTAGNPRQIERVPAGAIFKFELIVNIWTGDDEEELLNTLKEAMLLLESDYLGGNGSRGYGQIEFDNLQIQEIGNFDNWEKWTELKTFSL